MPYRDLRDFITRLEKEGELTRVSVEVDPVHELGAICAQAARADGPALLFESVRGYSMPVAANLLGKRRRIALGVNSTPEAVLDDWRAGISKPLSPVMVTDAPCQENVVLGDDIDLTSFLAAPVFNELDGGPYITSGCHISKSPETGDRNSGVYRNQVYGPREIGILAAPYRHIRRHEAEYVARGEPFPVAIAIGVDPTVFLGSVAAVPLGVDEMSVAGGLRGEPVEMVACKTIPVDVPANAEIVLECELTQDEMRDEGPFGEFTGYYSHVRPRPVVKVKAMTHRADPIHHATYLGRPPNESGEIEVVLHSANIMDQVKLPGLRKLHMTSGSSGTFKAIASIDKPFEGYGKMMAMAILGTWSAKGVKMLILVDSDVDPTNPIEVDWALSSRVQADRDVEIISGSVGVVLDPSIPAHDRTAGGPRTSKMIIDATRFDSASYPPAVGPHPDVLRRVVDDWDRYGIDL